MEKLDILIFGAHADDVEIGMAGTIAKHTAAGLKVGICDLTFAEMSSNGNPERRQREAEEAAAALGLTVRSNLGLADRGLFLTPEHIAAVTGEIRKYSPRIIFAPYWEDRHPDHVACSRLVEEAVFNAKLRKYLPDMPAAAVDELYFYFINDYRTPDLLIDVSEHYEAKRKSLRCYRSQFERAPGEDTVSTPLNQGYVERVEARDALLGQKKQVAFAEGFVMKSPYRIERFL